MGEGATVPGREPIPREKILAAYRAGPEAIVSLIQYLQDIHEGEIRTLQAEYDAKLAALSQQVKQLQERLHTDSHNSGKPPSSDGMARRAYPKRTKSKRKPGGQIGHEGVTLKRVEHPDHVVVHRAVRCRGCGTSLRRQPVQSYDRRQVFDVPPIRVEVTEHRAEIKCCPACGKRCVGEMSADAKRAVQYGPRLRAYAIYLKDYALLPFHRNAQLLEDLFGVHLSPGTLARMEIECAQRLQPIGEQLREAVRTAEVVHFDETGLSINGKLSWLHSASTLDTTYYRVHQRRGTEAIEAIGILPEFHGVAMHDGWASYARYGERHGLCNAHHLRELRFLWEEQKQRWAKGLADELRRWNKLVDQAKARGQEHLAIATLKKIEQRYEELLLAGMRANPPPPPTTERRRGRKKKSKARNFLDRLWVHREHVLRFAHDFRVPFTNNLAERDLRMMKVQQKISGTFRSWPGADAFALIRGYLSTIRKRGMNVIEAIAAVYASGPSLIATAE
jgi:transposase